MRNTLPFQESVEFISTQKYTFLWSKENCRKLYTNVAQKVNQPPQDSTSTDKYQKLREKRINLKANEWLTYQENLKWMDSTVTKQIGPCMKTKVNANTNTEKKHPKTTEQTKEKQQRSPVRPPDRY